LFPWDFSSILDDLVNYPYLIGVRNPFFISKSYNLGTMWIYIYTGRWPIEVVFRESKQYLGFQDSQARKQKAVTRTAPFCLWLNALIKRWFIREHQHGKIHLPPLIPGIRKKNNFLPGYVGCTAPVLLG
jgi:hypothetical protein